MFEWPKKRRIEKVNESLKKAVVDRADQTLNVITLDELQKKVDQSAELPVAHYQTPDGTIHEVRTSEDFHRFMEDRSAKLIFK